MRPIHFALAAIATSLLTCAPPDRARPDVPLVTLSGAELPRGPAPAEAMPLDDPEIATVAETIRDGVFDRARLARLRTTDPGLRRFVFRVLATAGDPGGIASLGFLPADSRLEEQVTRVTLARESDLADRSGYDFDRRFVAIEREAARETLDHIDRELLPAARDARLLERLRAMRATTESELRELDRIDRAITLAPRELPAPRPSSSP